MSSAPSSSPQTLLDSVRAYASRTPGREALVGGNSRWTWRELEARSNRAARALQRLGVRKGDRVGIRATNCPEWIEVFLGALKTGGIAVPLSPRLGPEELGRLIADAGLAFAVTAPELWEGVSFRGAVLALGSSYEAALAAESEDRLEAEPRADDVSVIAYTSGTTGIPKGAIWSHRSLLASARGNPFSAETAGGRRALLCVPLGTGGPLSMACNALAIGATLVVTPFTPENVLRVLVDERIEFVGLIPTMISFLVDAAPAEWRAPALRRIYYGAGTMSPQLFDRAERFFGCEFEQGYGMTETCITGTRLSPADHLRTKPELLSTAGKPMPGVDLKIVDEDGSEAPKDTPGEICIRCEANMLGYWNRPEETKAALRDGWYHSRDVGRLDERGYLTLLDRKDDMVKSGGFNVSPGEVESVLLVHPEVEEAAVVGLPDERWGQRVTAVVRRRSGARVSEAELEAFCRSQIAGFKVPRTILFTEEPLPRNALGKVVRQVLRNQVRAQVAE